MVTVSLEPTRKDAYYTVRVYGAGWKPAPINRTKRRLKRVTDDAYHDAFDEDVEFTARNVFLDAYTYSDTARVRLDDGADRHDVETNLQHLAETALDRTRLERGLDAVRDTLSSD